MLASEPGPADRTENSPSDLICPGCGLSFRPSVSAPGPRQSPSPETNRKRLLIFSAIMFVLGGLFFLVQWQAWQSRAYAETALELVQREIGSCLDPELEPGGSGLATVICPDSGRSFLVLRGQVLEVVTTAETWDDYF